MSQRIRVGDVFQVQIDASKAKYFQYVCDDKTQLDSQVVCAFQSTYPINEPIDLVRVISDAPAFHAHVFLRNGVRQKAWQKVGHAPVPSNPEVIFRDSNDYGNPAIKVSTNWHVWLPNHSFEKVGDLPPKYQHAEIGIVVPASSLIHRMREGRYDFVYPDFRHAGDKESIH